MQNQFESLRRPDIVGEVVSRDFKSTVVFDSSGQSLTVYTGELLPGVWSFGYQHSMGDKFSRVLPGELSGWFVSETDAKLYALEYLRSKISDESIREACHNIICKLITPTLF